MATIVTRAGKGSPLTNNEVDANFINLNTDKFEKSGDTANYLTLNTAAAATTAVAKVRWNTSTGTAALGLVGGNVETNVGQQLFAYVTNAESFQINKGQPVYLFGAQGDRATVKLASNTGDATSAKTLGLAAENIAAGQTGFVICQGVVPNVDTSAFNPGDTLYLGATAGTLTSTKPVAPNHLVYIGVVEKANAGGGQIYVRAQNGYELDELHDVLITSKTNGDVLMYNGTSGLWENKAQSNINAGSVSNGVYTLGDQTITGTKTFSSTIIGSINGNAGTVTNGVYTTGTYSNPSWITSLDGSKLTGTVVATNGVVTTGSYANPAWITSLDDGKVLPSMSGNAGLYLTNDGTNSSWAAVPSPNNGTLTLAVSGTGLSGSATFTANQAGNSTFTVTSNATNANTAGAIVARDGSGNFSAGTITATLNGNASTATSATSATNATNATNVNLTNDTTTNATHYFVFGDATSGNDALKVSSTKATFNPSTGSAVFAGDVTSSSDERVKTNWRSVQEDFVAKLANVKSGIYDRTDVVATQAGVSAQSLEEVLAEVVFTNSDGYKAVSYGQAALVAAVELAKQVVELKKEIAELKGKL